MMGGCLPKNLYDLCFNFDSQFKKTCMSLSQITGPFCPMETMGLAYMGERDRTLQMGLAFVFAVTLVFLPLSPKSVFKSRREFRRNVVCK